VVSAANAMDDSGSPGLDLGNLFLRKRRCEPGGRETDIALVDMDMVLKAPREGYSVVAIGTGAGSLERAGWGAL
jgi:hypothetical protein